jgi:hypothetical protein
MEKRKEGHKRSEQTIMPVPVNAILALVRYLECDERKHFEARWSSGEDVSRHIYHSIKQVSDWLDSQPGIPNAAERERERLAPLLEAFSQAGVQVQGDFADFWRSQKESEVN